VDGLSKKSAARLREAIHDLDLEKYQDGRLWFVTLTYPGNWSRWYDGRLVKADLQALFKRVRRHFGQELTAVWALEYQSRGAPHYHLCVDGQGLGDHASFCRWLAHAWNDLLSGGRNHLRVHLGAVPGGRPCVEPVKARKAVSYYLTNYCTKEAQKKPPEQCSMPGRMWGIVGGWSTPQVTCEVPLDGPEAVMLLRTIRRADDAAARRQAVGGRSVYIVANPDRPKKRRQADDEPKPRHEIEPPSFALRLWQRIEKRRNELLNVVRRYEAGHSVPEPATGPGARLRAYDELEQLLTCWPERRELKSVEGDQVACRQGPIVGLRLGDPPVWVLDLVNARTRARRKDRDNGHASRQGFAVWGLSSDLVGRLFEPWQF
jgi:hypothetical protein